MIEDIKSTVASSPGHSHVFIVTLKMWEWPGDEAILLYCTYTIHRWLLTWKIPLFPLLSVCPATVVHERPSWSITFGKVTMSYSFDHLLVGFYSLFEERKYIIINHDLSHNSVIQQDMLAGFWVGGGT